MGRRRRSYTVTVTRAGSPQTRTLSLLSLSGVTLSPCVRVGDSCVHGVGGAWGDGDDGGGDGGPRGRSYEVKLNGVVDQDGVVPLAVVASGNVIAVVVTAQDGEIDADVHGDGDAGWIR